MQQNASDLVSLALGGVRSGNSRYAQQVAERAKNVVSVATDSAENEEMRFRVDRRRADQPAHCRTVEEPLELAAAIRSLAPPADLILIDRLTFFAATLLEPCGSSPATLEGLCAALIAPPCTVVLVSNQAGSGVVPPYPLGRRYRDLLEDINQRVARVATEVGLMVAGIPLLLKLSSGFPGLIR